MLRHFLFVFFFTALLAGCVSNSGEFAKIRGTTHETGYFFQLNDMPEGTVCRVETARGTITAKYPQNKILFPDRKPHTVVCTELNGVEREFKSGLNTRLPTRHVSFETDVHSYNASGTQYWTFIWGSRGKTVLTFRDPGPGFFRVTPSGWERIPVTCPRSLRHDLLCTDFE